MPFVGPTLDTKVIAVTLSLFDLRTSLGMTAPQYNMDRAVQV